MAWESDTAVLSGLDRSLTLIESVERLELQGLDSSENSNLTKLTSF